MTKEQITALMFDLVAKRKLMSMVIAQHDMLHQEYGNLLNELDHERRLLDLVHFCNTGSYPE